MLIAAPHTSNWDLAYLLALAVLYDVRSSWMGKHTLFRGPMGPIMRALGGIPVRRQKRENLVDAMAPVLMERGVAVLGYEPAWHRTPPTQLDDFEARLAVTEAMNVLQWLGGREGVDPNRLGVVGYSSAAIVSACLAGRAERLAGRGPAE